MMLRASAAVFTPPEFASANPDYLRDVFAAGNAREDLHVLTRLQISETVIRRILALNAGRRHHTYVYMPAARGVDAEHVALVVDRGDFPDDRSAVVNLFGRRARRGAGRGRAGGGQRQHHEPEGECKASRHHTT